MNRENKRKSFEKGYYKTHACSEVFTCKTAAASLFPEAQAVPTATTARTVFAACTSTRTRREHPPAAG